MSFAKRLDMSERPRTPSTSSNAAFPPNATSNDCHSSIELSLSSGVSAGHARPRAADLSGDLAHQAIGTIAHLDADSRWTNPPDNYASQPSLEDTELVRR